MTALPTLEWFPKPFGPGDTDGSGAQRLLGQPDLTIAELLVRETAQNSWDASIGMDRRPEFQMRYRTLTDHVTGLLKNHVFTQVVEGSNLERALNRPGLDAVEIVDRGTRGLGGPTRNDFAVDDGQVTDYADFVLTVGAPPDHAHGGGTYGYGKTASYMASSCSTIIIWSRARDPRTGLINERFIASSMDATFIDSYGKKFTGRQWWGLQDPDLGPDVFAVAPVSGYEAKRLGEAVFERHFDSDETGTSLLILAPRKVEDSEGSLVELWRDAIEANLWPKLIPSQDPEWAMKISLTDNGEEVPLGNGLDPFVRKARQDCLLSIRAAQDGAPVVNHLVQLREIRHGLYNIVLGHLAMSRVLGPMGEGGRDNSVTYMRNKAELVVQEDGLNLAPSDGRWVAVFKPVAETDRHFAMSEPPAHDSWNPKGMTDRRAKSCVNVAMSKIKQEVKDYLRPKNAGVDAGDQHSTGKLSAALGGLVMGAAGSRPLPRTSVGKAAKKSRTAVERKPRVEVVKSVPVAPTASDLAQGRQRLLVELMNPSSIPVRVAASSMAIAVDGQGGVDKHEVELDAWNTPAGTVTDLQIVMAPNTTAEAYITSPDGVAVQYSFSAEVVS